MLSKAGEFGFDGVELRGLQGQLNLTREPRLTANPGATRALFAASKVELVCLASSCTLDSRKSGVLARHRAELEEYIELAATLGCPFVRLFAGELQPGDSRESALSRIGRELAEMAQVASRNKVTLLLNNSGDFLASADLWYLMDFVSHPAVQVCWNPCSARTCGERPTVSVPRLGTKIGIFHICDGTFDENGWLSSYCLPGTGEVELSRAIELLRGIAFRDYLIFEWPKLWEKSLPGPEVALPDVKRFLRECVDAKQAILTAYKGDKNPTRFRKLPERAPARPI